MFKQLERSGGMGKTAGGASRAVKLLGSLGFWSFSAD